MPGGACALDKEPWKSRAHGPQGGPSTTPAFLFTEPGPVLNGKKEESLALGTRVAG